jgi:hypothetical protein
MNGSNQPVPMAKAPLFDPMFHIHWPLFPIHWNVFEEGI